ncbi:hypothetical protein DV735_g983, partial [Chaetothyriales sp. CBS 134920]
MAGPRSNITARIHPVRDNEQTSKYEYEQLQQMKVRILSLHPGRPDDQITCSLKTFLFNDCPLYTAISHRWIAPGGDIATIWIDGKQLNIQPAVFELLRTLRQRHELRTLWIDAICINQADDSEKAGQIPLMREIYSRASCSIAWLEKSTLISPINVLHVARCYSKAKLAGEHGCEWCEGLYGKDQDLANAFTELFEHEYWTRRWIIQEVVLASTVEVQCGNEITPLSNLIAFVRDASKGKTCFPWEMTPHARSQMERLNQSLPLRLHRDRLEYQSNWDLDSEPSFRDLLFRYRSSACSELSDKVFALLPLSPNALGWVKVDYQMSPADLVTSVVQFCYHSEEMPCQEVIQLGCLLIEELEVDIRSYQPQLAAADADVKNIDKNAITHTVARPFDAYQEVIIMAFHLGTLTSGITVGEEFTISELRRKARGLIQYPPLLLKDKALSDSREMLTLEIPKSDSLSSTPGEAVAAKDFWTFMFGIASVKILPGDVLWYFKGTDLALIARKAGYPYKPGDMMIVGRAYLGWIPDDINTEDEEEKELLLELPSVRFALNLDLFASMLPYISSLRIPAGTCCKVINYDVLPPLILAGLALASLASRILSYLNNNQRYIDLELASATTIPDDVWSHDAVEEYWLREEALKSLPIESRTKGLEAEVAQLQQEYLASYMPKFPVVHTCLLLGAISSDWDSTYLHTARNRPWNLAPDWGSKYMWQPGCTVFDLTDRAYAFVLPAEKCLSSPFPAEAFHLAMWEAHSFMKEVRICGPDPIMHGEHTLVFLREPDLGRLRVGLVTRDARGQLQVDDPAAAARVAGDEEAAEAWERGVGALPAWTDMGEEEGRRYRRNTMLLDVAAVNTMWAAAAEIAAHKPPFNPTPY